jgi:hypothetical protein
MPMSRGWVNSFIGRYLDQLCKMKNVPQEAQRFEVPHSFLDESIQSIAQFVQGSPVEFVSNFDEIDISEWDDRKTKKEIVPVSARDHTIYHKINQALKHVSVIVCMSAAGESLMPYIVTSQDSAKLQEQLKNAMYAFESI